MKKQLSLFGWAAAVFGLCAMVAPISGAFAATNSGSGGASVADLSSGPGAKSSASVTEYKKYETRTSTATYNVKPAATTTQRNQNLYYVAPNRAPVETRAAAAAPAGTTTLQSARAETVKEISERKYYLAHPFYQPAEGCFNSLTDLGYTMNSYDFAITDGGWGGLGGEWSARQFTVKEDLSYGITDTVAIIGSARYAHSKYKFDWQDPLIENDDMTQSGFDVLGLGMQWRFYDGPEWIAYLGAYYQWWKDLSNVVAADAKVGYKLTADSTLYGLARLYYVMWDENSYGNGITNDARQSLFLAYDQGVDNTVFIEGGIGYFVVLAKDWTLNLEGVIGDYGWHTQGSLMAAFGWQPTRNFALNLYGKTAVFDTANDAKGLKMYAWDAANPVTFEGNVSLSKYRETTFGLQVMFQF